MFENYNIFADPFAVIYNSACSKVYMMKEDRYIFNLDEKGIFSLWKNNTQSFTKRDVSETRSYCIEHTKKRDVEGYFFFMCFPERNINEKFTYTSWPKMLSCVCLAMTIAVYLILNETRNLFGKILVNYCVALFFENAVLTYAQLSLHPTGIDCKIRSKCQFYLKKKQFFWNAVYVKNIFLILLTVI